MVGGCRIKRNLTLQCSVLSGSMIAFEFDQHNDNSPLWKRRDSAELVFAKTSGIITGWDALVSYWLVFFPLSLVTVPEGFATVNSAQFLRISKVATLILILGWHYFRVAPSFFIKL